MTKLGIWGSIIPRQVCILVLLGILNKLFIAVLMLYLVKLAGLLVRKLCSNYLKKVSACVAVRH